MRAPDIRIRDGASEEEGNRAAGSAAAVIRSEPGAFTSQIPVAPPLSAVISMSHPSPDTLACRSLSGSEEPTEEQEYRTVAGRW